jgi:hypothetical protein
VPGHVFIAQGDLTRLACDAWLLPCDGKSFVTESWFENAPQHLKDEKSTWRRARGSNGARLVGLPEAELLRPRTTADGGDRARRFVAWHDPNGLRQAWLVNTGRWDGASADWYADGVEQFIKAASSSLPAEGIHGRYQPLLGVPLVGTGQGGADQIKGDVIEAILRVLHQQARTSAFDIVLVTNTRAAFTAAQAARRSTFLGAGSHADSHWPELDDRLRQTASDLAVMAAQGKLVLFLGSGIGVGAGLPTWKALLLKLAGEAGISDDEQQALSKLQALDQARIIETRLHAVGRNIGEVVSRLLDAEVYSLTHALLASLPVQEIVTVNYDRLFEIASEAVMRPPAVLPYMANREEDRWLLKMHGCVKHPEHIVLTREQYLRYSDSRAALAGIVQALLITRHMLFAGFSLTDDNFHQIVDAVRKAVSTAGALTEHFGTALVLEEDQLMEELWRGDIKFVSMSNGETVRSEGVNRVQAKLARRFEIFLDYLLGAATTNTPHLLDPDYSGVLTREETEVKTLLNEFKRNFENISPAARETPAGIALSELLTSFGADAKKSPNPRSSSL